VEVSRWLAMEQPNETSKPVSGDAKTGTDKKTSAMESKDGADLIQAKWENLSVGSTVYIREKKAEVSRLDWPLMYWVFEGEKSEKHRSFLFDTEIFKVGATKESKDSGGTVEEPLSTRIEDLENEEYECEGVTSKHTVEIKGCKNSSIEIFDEVYGINMSDCKDVLVVFHSITSSCDMHNCVGCQVFCMADCCLFDIHKSDKCKVMIGNPLLKNVLFSTMQSDNLDIVAFEEMTREIVEIIKDGDEVDTITTYTIPSSMSPEGQNTEIELRTKWTGQGFATKTIEDAKECDVAPDFGKDEFDPFSG